MKRKYEVAPALIKRLRSLNCPFPQTEEEETPRSFLTIEVSQRHLTKAYDRRSDAEFVFAVRITNQSYNRLEIQGIKCQLDWPAHMNWLVDPLICRGDKGPYRLPSGAEFPRETVLNHRTGPAGVIDPGGEVEGVLLGICLSQRIPHDYLAGTAVPADFSLVDQYEIKHHSTIEIEIDRTATSPPRRLSPRRSTLYDPVGYEVSDANRRSPRASSVVPRWPAGPAVVELNNEKE